MGPPGYPRRRGGPSGWNFDIDNYLNPLFPPFLLHRLPSFVSHFLGHRTHAPQRPLGNLVMVLWAVVGVFASLACIGAASRSIPAFEDRGVPAIIASFGAAAVLDFYAIESPLAQPRNAVLGQAISAAAGVAVCKLFALSPRFDDVRWLGASVSCACAMALMALTGTVHPPAGATALMIVLDPTAASLGWFIFAPLMLGCGIMLGVALLVNNIQRRFPFYWWSPGETGSFWRRKLGAWPARGAREEEGVEKEEEGVRHGRAGELDEGTGGRVRPTKTPSAESSGSLVDEESDAATLSRMVSVLRGREGEIVIRRGYVTIPEGLGLRPEEILSLETLSERL
ncbi:hypothetical protein VTJ83DRAFT_1376 [Remersonia thermophila]|uniref:HPP transmembrane region domain-containing protein n=1 Tax=Remersonia thermophila TaxID=72144 RepID=A0ABR4DP20_9PEZI